MLTSSLSQCGILIQTCKGARACRRWYVLRPPTHLYKVLKFSLPRYEDTYSMDQSLREEAVLALEAETRTNPLRRKMGPSLERAEKVETFSYASSFCASLDLVLKWIKTQQQEFLKTCQSRHGRSHRQRIIYPARARSARAG